MCVLHRYHAAHLEIRFAGNPFRQQPAIVSPAYTLSAAARRGDLSRLVAEPQIQSGRERRLQQLRQEGPSGEAVTDPETAAQEVDVSGHEDDTLEDLGRKILDRCSRLPRLETTSGRPVAALLPALLLVLLIPPSFAVPGPTSCRRLPCLPGACFAFDFNLSKFHGTGWGKGHASDLGVNIRLPRAVSRTPSFMLHVRP